ncbi:MAG TPA: hypothetical protein DDW87_09105 [Firmicutes bacterium]|nr:hypothetical protein [Bacillota bacterium]
MGNVTGGLLLAFVGFFLGFVTYKKYSLFWNFFDTRLFRKYLGDIATSIILYTVSSVFIVVGALLAVGLVH